MGSTGTRRSQALRVPYSGGSTGWIELVNDSDEVDQIETDLEETDLENMDSELVDIETELDSSLSEYEN